MIRRASLLALAGFGLAIAPAAWADSAPSDAAAPVARSIHKKSVDPNLDDNAVVCQREETTGSRLGGAKVCHTRAEWNARSAAARSEVNSWQNQGNMTMPH